MSKIVQAVNSIIAKPDLITNVMKNENEVFFLYKNKYKWSMSKREDGHHLWFYPGTESLESLAAMDGNEWGYADVSMVHYHDAEIGTKEARASFAELYTVLSEKVFGINEVLDDIISDTDEL